MVNTTYYYSNGVYYQKTGNSYVVVSAPAGATVEHAPTDVATVTAQGQEYGYSNGTYYGAEVSDDGEAKFVVVEAPLGAIVPTLPDGAQKISIGGKDYFEYSATYYQPFYSGSDVVYMVVKDPAG